MATERIWYCKIGGPISDEAWRPEGEWHYTPNDPALRDAVTMAYKQRFGVEPEFVFSGWGAELTEPERAAAEDRPPNS